MGMRLIDFGAVVVTNVDISIVLHPSNAANHDSKGGMGRMYSSKPPGDGSCTLK